MPFLQPNGLYLTGFDELVCQTDEERRLLLRHEQTDVRVSSLRSLCRSVHSLHITHQTLPGRHGAQVSFWSIRWGSEYQTCAMQRGSDYRASSFFEWSKRGWRLVQYLNAISIQVCWNIWIVDKWMPSCFLKMVGQVHRTKHIDRPFKIRTSKRVFKCFWYSNGCYSDPHCSFYFGIQWTSESWTGIQMVNSKFRYFFVRPVKERYHLKTKIV